MTNPFIDFSLFKKNIFLGGVLSTSCNQFILMITIFWAMYFQTTLGYSPVKAGLLTLFTNIPVLIMAPFAGTWLDKKGPRAPVITGFCSILFSLLWFSLFAGNRSVLYLFPSLFFFGCGIPLVFTPSGTATITQAPEEKRGLAIGTNLTIRQFGGTLGLSIFGALFLQIHITKFNHFLKAGGIKQVSAAQLDGLLAKAPKAMKTLHALSQSTQDVIMQSSLQATEHAFSMINLLGVLIAICGIVAAATLFKRPDLPTALKA